MRDDQRSVLGRELLSCSEIELFLDDYIDGELEPEQVIRFERHLERCSSCNSLVLDCQHLVQVAKTLSHRAIPGDVRMRLHQRLEAEGLGKFRDRKLRVISAERK